MVDARNLQGTIEANRLLILEVKICVANEEGSFCVRFNCSSSLCSEVSTLTCQFANTSDGSLSSPENLLTNLSDLQEKSLSEY